MWFFLTSHLAHFCRFKFDQVLPIAVASLASFQYYSTGYASWLFSRPFQHPPQPQELVSCIQDAYLRSLDLPGSCNKIAWQVLVGAVFRKFEPYKVVFSRNSKFYFQTCDVQVGSLRLCASCSLPFPYSFDHSASRIDSSHLGLGVLRRGYVPTRCTIFRSCKGTGSHC